MGQKVNPIGMRLQVNRTWDSRWFAESKDFGNLLLEDLRIREFIHKECKQAGISKVVIERPHRKCRVTIYSARPGVIIGKKGADIETLRKKVAAFTASDLHLNIVEVRKPEVDAQLVAESIAQQMERRVSFRRAMKRGVQNAMRMGALGIRVNVAGRLGGAEIARTEWYREGRVPLHTLRADIETLRKKVAAFTASELHLNIVEVRKPEVDAQLVAESIAQQMERRVSFRRAMKRGVQNAMRMGALGIRVNVGGRLGGAEIARTEWYREGRVPLHTLRADIDYALSEAVTPYGIIGVKVWIFKGEILEHDPQAHDRRLAEAADAPAPRGPRRERGDRERA